VVAVSFASEVNCSDAVALKPLGLGNASPPSIYVLSYEAGRFLPSTEFCDETLYLWRAQSLCSNLDLIAEGRVALALGAHSGRNIVVDVWEQSGCVRCAFGFPEAIQGDGALLVVDTNSEWTTSKWRAIGLGGQVLTPGDAVGLIGARFGQHVQLLPNAIVVGAGGSQILGGTTSFEWDSLAIQWRIRSVNDALACGPYKVVRESPSRWCLGVGLVRGDVGMGGGTQLPVSAGVSPVDGKLLWVE